MKAESVLQCQLDILVREDFSKRLKTLRGDMPQAELARKIGVKAPMISAWETKQSKISIERLCQLAIIFNCTLESLVDPRCVLGE